ncbi:MAG: N-acetylmuramoyl-L-alanine amidase, partial [Vicinamibacterales bacterium]
MYTRALARERQVRDAANRTTLTRMRSAIRAYEAVVRRFPRSGYCDNALWQAGHLAALAFERFHEPSDRRTAIRLFKHLKSGYPSSDYAGRTADVIAGIEAIAADPPPAAVPAVATAKTAAGTPAPAASASANAGSRTTAAADADAAAKPATGIVTIRDIKRIELADGVRVSIEMDGESLYHSERLENPSRLFFDLKGTRPTLSLQDATIRFPGDIIREIRLGRHPQQTTRIVMDLESVEAYSVFTLYNPFRLVVDFRRNGAAVAAVSLPPATTPAAVPAVRITEPDDADPAPPRPAAARTAGADAKSVPAAKEPVPMVSRPVPKELISPTPPSTNANGQFSIARQLGLGISRIVLDAGHGGHDPGARANGLSEADLVLDVTLRLRQLLEKQPGVEVTLTRDKDVFIPLEERTAIANRTGADLFLSIHANASRNTRARGIETYFLNFASNPEAEAVAARENSASGRSMHSLPEIVRAIALNNKIDESRDFADMVQKSMVRRLSARNSAIRDLGVKQAPFVVLIGAGMPSVLAEISFVTSRSDSTLLKTESYRQQIAESLFDAIVRYQRSLKGARAVARRE